jgi:hypothetical protein
VTKCFITFLPTEINSYAGTVSAYKWHAQFHAHLLRVTLAGPCCDRGEDIRIAISSCLKSVSRKICSRSCVGCFGLFKNSDKAVI